MTTKMRTHAEVMQALPMQAYVLDGLDVYRIHKQYPKTMLTRSMVEEMLTRYQLTDVEALVKVLNRNVRVSEGQAKALSWFVESNEINALSDPANYTRDGVYKEQYTEYGASKVPRGGAGDIDDRYAPNRNIFNNYRFRLGTLLWQSITKQQLVLNLEDEEHHLQDVIQIMHVDLLPELTETQRRDLYDLGFVIGQEYFEFHNKNLWM